MLWVSACDIVLVESGVPQDSILEPSLFLYYINDIPAGLTSTIRLFADDTISYLAIKSNRDALKLQQHNLIFRLQELLLVFGWKVNFQSSCLIRPVCHNSVVIDHMKIADVPASPS
jgi:hypothetical protein